MKIWLFNTPEVNAATIFLSCPVALAVSLWGMTSSKIQNTLNLSLKRGGRWVSHSSYTVFRHLTRLVSGCSISSALLPPSACSSSALSRNVASDSEASDASAPTTPTKAPRSAS